MLATARATVSQAQVVASSARLAGSVAARSAESAARPESRAVSPRCTRLSMSTSCSPRHDGEDYARNRSTGSDASKRQPAQPAEHDDRPSLPVVLGLEFRDVAVRLFRMYLDLGYVCHDPALFGGDLHQEIAVAQVLNLGHLSLRHLFTRLIS